MKGSSIAMAAVRTVAILVPSSRADEPGFTPYGFQSGNFDDENSSELLNDDTYAGSMYYDAQHNLVFFTGLTYGTYFDSAYPTELSDEVRGAMGMSSAPGGRDSKMPHLISGDCFLGVLKLPRPDGSLLDLQNGISNPAPWLVHIDEDGLKGGGAKLIYARRFGTPQNSEACSSILMLPKVNDALLQTPAQLKLALLGHVNPAPLSSAEVNAMGPSVKGQNYDAGDAVGPNGGGERWLRQIQRESKELENDHQLDGGRSESNAQHDQQPRQHNQSEERGLQSVGNRGGFLHSITSSGPIVEGGRSYGFVADFDLSLTVDETYSPGGGDGAADGAFNNAYGALLGGHVLETSPLIYPVAMTQNRRDPNQLYVVSMHSDREEVVENPKYLTTTREELDGSLHRRPDLTMGGAGGSMSTEVGDGGDSRVGSRGGVPKFGTDFYVKVQQLSVTPYEQLMDVEPTFDEKVKRTMTSGWGFGFKLNDANDVRPSSIAFVKGRTPDEDLLLLGGTALRIDEDNPDGKGELDGFITKLIPPPPAPVADQTFGSSIEGAVEDESVHPTKRIDSTTDKDETVTAICVPPPDDPLEGVTTHAFVVGSTSPDRGTQAKGSDPSLAYILKMRLDDLSTVWKEHIPSIHLSGIGGDVLGEGCAVSPDGKMVYLSGTIDGGSALNTGMPNMNPQPVGGTSDVFVVAYDVDFGNVQWAKQLGSVYEDKLARGGGVECDNEGNVIVMGSTRGGLQRFRSDASKRHQRRELQGQAQELPQMPSHMASDIFIMSLSRKDGEYVNAPYAGGDVAVGASGGTAPSAAASATPEPTMASDGRGPGGITGITLVLVGIAAALAFLVMRRRQVKWRKRYSASERMWERDGGDDFSIDGSGMLGGRRSSAMHAPKGRSPIRILRGQSNDSWDSGTESVSKNATWMGSGDDGAGGGEDSSSVYSAGSGGSRGSYSRKHMDDNSDFLASLRQEANSTMKKMIKDDTSETGSGGGATSDPRLDGGASIKSLLTHYREVKKGGLFEGGDGDDGASTKSGGSGDGGSKKGNSKKQKGRSKPPPPPPPPRKNKGQAAAKTSPEPDGLSEFTIV